MNRWQLFGDRVSRTTTFAVLTLVLWLMAQWLQAPILRYFVGASAVITILLLIWTIWQTVLAYLANSRSTRRRP
ncbi:hypothetical protein [Lapidilactobacillus luobeiensis]|uniref:hypothetical protein n=1 Tax=Lapidilactobacillus luobeiensis TaxID=2950371 RepID=UPI0021C35003|nr:hypothetical protein [Lapidilactobacillus luobeiensis]